LRSHQNQPVASAAGAGLLLGAGRDRAVQPRADVVEFRLQPCDPRKLLCRAQLRVGLFDERTHPRAVPTIHLGAQLGDLVGALGGVLVDRLQHAVPHPRTAVPGARGRDDQGLVDE
jgi:hypothetical protein